MQKLLMKIERTIDTESVPGVISEAPSNKRMALVLERWDFIPSDNEVQFVFLPSCMFYDCLSYSYVISFV